MTADFCAYPPRVAADVEITQDRDGDRLAYIVGSAMAGRYLLLRETEYDVLGLLGQRTLPEICDEFKRRHGATLSLPTLTRFLAKLDHVGILAGERVQRPEAWGQLSGSPYFRINLFNPERMFSRVTSALRWIWTKEFFFFTVALILIALCLGLINWAELKSYSLATLREHYVAILVTGVVIGFTHEFAHGLTSKAFGGRATEVGVLMIYYVLPGLYCNVSGLHLIRQRHQRLWVIAAGIYWQLLLGTIALFVWLVFAPHTFVAKVALIIFLASILDVFINANPLIKLDGYYFLSQWLRLPNLMDRSRAYWRGLMRRVIFGARDDTAAKARRPERVIYAVYGLASTLYVMVLLGGIVWFVGDYLVDSFFLLGLLLAIGLPLLFLRRPLKQIISTGTSLSASWVTRIARWRSKNDECESMDEPPRFRRFFLSFLTWRRFIFAMLVLLVIVTLLVPWSASVGNYGTLAVIPGQEAIIRAPESASLIELRVTPGDRLASGAIVGRMRSVELDDQTAEVQSELARARTEHHRLQGELRAHEELAARAELQWRQRQHDHDELAAEQQQINARGNCQPEADGGRTPRAQYPATIAALEADVELREARLAEANKQLDRARALSSQGILPVQEKESAETHSSTLTLECSAARQRLEASLVEHRRKHASASTDMLLARSDLKAEQAQIQKLNGELVALQALIEALEQRLALFHRRRAHFELVTPFAGAVFGEDLPRQTGQHFRKGAEICRVADTHRLLLRIRVPETEIGDVQVGEPVRMKARAFPDQLFRGTVSRIGSESEPDEHRRTTYRVELIVENRDGLLRAGMTAFARIDFDRQIIGQILLHKLKQALRPELWML